jgi:hypothetical protein
MGPLKRLLLLLPAVALLDPLPASPANCESGTDPNVCLLIPDGSASDDVAPYCFLPALPRGQNPSNYAVTANDDDGACHNFETYLKFELPQALLLPGETVTAAFLDVPYAFSFSIEGPPVPPPHPPVTLRVHRVRGAWTEDGVTWILRPGYDATPLDSYSNLTNFESVVFDVTEVVRAWAHGTAANHGFALTSPNDRVLGFHSWEAVPPVTENQKVALLIVRGSGAPPPACGDVDVDGGVDAADLATFRLSLADPVGHPLTSAGAARCNIVQAGQACSLRDTVALARSLAAPPLAPGVAPVCSALGNP